MVAVLRYSVSDIAEITNGELNGSADQMVHSVLTDSRKVNSIKNTMFIAISGANHNGHLYISELYSKGLRIFLIEEDVQSFEYSEASFIKVESSIHALQALASHHRRKFSFPQIAITGSNGKTIIKEWLFKLLHRNRNIIRSPKSYNSQLGVSLSILAMDKNHDLGIFEAGISKPGEMERLNEIILPDICIFSNLGSAHDSGFKNRTEKLVEKLKLTKHSKTLIAYAEDEKIANEILDNNLADDIILWSFNKLDEDLHAIHVIKNENKIEFTQKKNYTFHLPHKDEASVENSISAILTALYLGLDRNSIQESLKDLEPVAMRLEMKAGLNNSTIVNDAYNADPEGVFSAIDFLKAQTENENYTVIISDLMETKENSEELYSSILRYVEQNSIQKLITIGEQWKQLNLKSNSTQIYSYADATSFISELDEYSFNEEAILIKGARKFQLEKISELLERHKHKTVLELDLNAFTNNLTYYRNLLEADTKIMVMVKAFSYGAGSFEIAKLLEYQKVDYLAVAYTDEGVTLREAGIMTPIMVMNPQSYEFKRLKSYSLEPEIYSKKILDEWLESSKNDSEQHAIHLKINTGMNRLGFSSADIDDLSSTLKKHKLKVASIFSHLAASDDPSKESFSLSQVEQFQTVYRKIESALGYSVLKHILNSAGIENHLEHQLDMVRLGIGLYGIGSPELESISTFKTYISQIREVESGEIIGYGADNPQSKKITIAIINAGYSDGLDRRLSNGVGEVLINNTRAPIIGKVCMDMTMVDITSVNSVSVGDEVILFNKDLTVSEMAKKIGTIPYEILTGVSQRIPRIYFKD